MDKNSKTSMYNSSTYGRQQAAKQAVFNNSKYGKMQAKLAANSAESNTTKKVTLDNGKVLVRAASSSKYINFKSLFGSISADDSASSDASTLALFDSMKTTSNNIMSAYEKQSKQRLGLR